MAAGQGGSCWLVVTGTVNPLPESALSLYAFRPTRGALCNELPPFVQCLCRGMPMQFWSKLYGSVLVFLFVMATAVFAAEELAALRDRAERGDAQAQCALGERYRYGRGVDRDAALAFAWFQKAALQGYADGQSKLGAMYFAGRGGAGPGTRGSSFSGRARPRNRAMPLPRAIWAGLTKRVGGWAGMPVGRRMVRQGLSGAARDGGGRASGSPVQSGQYVSHGLGSAQR